MNEVEATAQLEGTGGTSPDLTPDEQPAPVQVAHVADYNRRYPGEVVTFFSRVQVGQPVANLTLRVSLPAGLTLGDYRALTEKNGLMPQLAVGNEANYLVWSLAGDLPAGATREFQAEASVVPSIGQTRLESRAVVTDSSQAILAEETATIAVRSKGGYIQHLPALYEQDDLIGRFLMLFESFWKPIDQQTDHISFYLDPRITPPRFLPWLAAWLDLELDEDWPEPRRRQLIRWAIALHRSRGTKWGLTKYLEIYTGQKAEITEHRANNFVLGNTACLGPGIAMGRGNRPHTFTVTLRLPPLEIEDEAERVRQGRIRRRTIEAIIARQKPAHTVYSLQLYPLSASELETQPKGAAAQVDQAAVEASEIDAQAAIWFKLDDG